MTALHVVAAVIYNEDQSEVLLSLRNPHQDQGGLWEFPGGKLEPGEDRESGLRRELREELGIDAQDCKALMQVQHHYPASSSAGTAKDVLLDVFEVRSFEGQPQGLEQQSIAWVSVEQLAARAFPAANRPVVQRLLGL